MRKHMLGGIMPPCGHTPAYSLRSRAAELIEKQDKPRLSTVMSWFPSRRGKPRSVPLLRFSHIPMAELLEADPDVDFWYSNIPSDPGATELMEDADFVVRMGQDRISYRIKRAPSPALSDARSAFESMASDRRVVLDSAALLADPRLPIAHEILRVRGLRISRKLVLAAVDLVTAVDGPRTLGTLHEALGTADVSWDLIKAFIGRGYIKVHLADSLEASTPITGVRLKGWRS